MIAAALLLPAAVFAPALAAPFSLQDDYEIPLMAGAVGPPRDALTLFTESIRNDARANGRFRPLFYGLRVVQARVIGPYPFLLHLMPLALLLGSVGVLIAVGRSMRLGAWPAILLSWLVVLNPRGWEIWSMLVLQESAGILCISVSLLAMIRGATSARRWAWDIAAAAFAILAALAKEPFVLALPALVAARIGADAVLGRASLARAFKRSAPLIAVLVLVSAAELIAVLAVVTAGTYSSGLLHRSSLAAGAWRVVRYLLDSSFYLLPAACFLVAYVWKRWGKMPAVKGAAIAIGTAALVWIVPTGALQAAVGVAGMRYIFPMALGAAIANAAAFACLRARATGHLRWVLDIAMIAWLTHCAAHCHAGTWKFAAQAQIADDAIQAVTRDVPRDGLVLLVADVAKQVEPANSMVWLIASSGRQDIHVDVLDVAASRPAATDEDIRAMARGLLHIVRTADMGDYQSVLAAPPTNPLPATVAGAIPGGFKAINLERRYREAFCLSPTILHTTVYVRR
ncbi:MAG: hypothetical protein ACE15C_19590 [Phycisphaerae bacterium]